MMLFNIKQCRWHSVALRFASGVRPPLVCAAAAEHRKQSASPETRANDTLSLYGG